MQKSRVFMAGVLAMSASVCADALAQRTPTSVTIYGVVDAGIARSSNQNGQSNVYEKSGALSANRIGFKGSEDLGGGTQAVFLLESGFDIDTGAQAEAGSIFNRQTWVGLVDRRYGSILLGRQYTSYTDMVGALGPTVSMGGQAAAHPGDIDNLDTTTRINNSIKYISPEWRGLQMSALAGTGEQAGHNGSGASYSVAVKYDYKAWKLALGYQNLKNTDTPGARGAQASAQINTSSVNTGYRSADTVQAVGAAARYRANDKLTLGASATNVQYRPDAGSLFKDTAIFNTVGVLALYTLTPAWTINSSYSYTRMTEANGIDDPAHYSQLTLEETYSFSKRTTFYMAQVYQLAGGFTLDKSGKVIRTLANAAGSQNSTPSSNGRQNVLMVGLRVRF